MANSIEGAPASPRGRSESMPDDHTPPRHDEGGKKKTWREYFLEFLMIFLGVTLGFIAENYREYLGERSKERDYIMGLIRNLEDDVNLFDHVIGSDRNQIKGLDSLLTLSHANMAIDSNRKAFYHYVRIYCYNLSTFKSNDATLQQLKSTGDYTLIKEDHVADSLSKYDGDIHSLYKQGDYYENYFKEIVSRLDELADMTILGDTALLSKDKLIKTAYPPLRMENGKLTTFFNKIMVFRIITHSYVDDNLVPRSAQAKRLITHLKDRYDI